MPTGEGVCCCRAPSVKREPVPRTGADCRRRRPLVAVTVVVGLLPEADVQVAPQSVAITSPSRLLSNLSSLSRGTLSTDVTDAPDAKER